MNRKPYPTDRTDDPWGHLGPLLPDPNSGTRRGGRPATDLLYALRLYLTGDSGARAIQQAQVRDDE